VRIADGVFAGMEGKVVSTYRAPGSALELVRVEVVVLGRPVPVELEPHQLEGGSGPRRHVAGRPPRPWRGHCPVTVLSEGGGSSGGGGDRPEAPLPKEAVPGWPRPWQAMGREAPGGAAGWSGLGALTGLCIVLLGAWLADAWFGQGSWLAPALVGAFAGVVLGLAVCLLTRRDDRPSGSAP
jgi:hypothetical protein